MITAVWPIPGALSPAKQPVRMPPPTPQPQNNTRSILNSVAEGLGHQGLHLFKGVDFLLIIADNQAKVAQVLDTSQTMYARYERGAKAATAVSLGDPGLNDLIGERLHRQLTDDAELLDRAAEFDLEKVRHGKLSPVFFGSALTNFGVEPFLEGFLRMTTPPLSRMAGETVIDSMDDDFSAFVFKIQANMNAHHRDRIAFMRVVSGRFDADKEVYHVQGGKKLRLSRPQQLMAAEREIIEEAYAGDIIGVFDPGIFSIGDTLCTPGKKFQFDPIPTFAPEHFRRVRPLDTMKRKQFLKGAEQIAQEGAIQMFKAPYTGMEEIIVGVVGTLQFDVLEYRLKNEYGVDIFMEGLPYEYLRWITAEDGEPVKEENLTLGTDTKLVEDFKGRQLLLFGSKWAVNWTQERNPQLTFAEFGGAGE